MSVMLEALRKAEKQSRRATAAAGATIGTDKVDALREPLQPEEPVRAVGTATEFALEPAPELAPHAALEPEHGRDANARSVVEPVAAKRGTAPRWVGEDARLPFRLVLGLLGAGAAGAIAYFWIQLQPGPAATGVVPPQPVRAQALQSAPPPAASPAIPGLPDLASVGTTEPVAVASRSSAAPTLPVRASAAAIAAPPKVPAAPAPERVEIARIPIQVQSGYRALQAGELDAARTAYEQALREEPGNRDALLGMAALEIQARRYDQAEARYRTLLRSSPRDPYAIAGLLALRGSDVDPVHAESSLKNLLAANPDAVPLHFALGNQFARQGRWAEAQLAYVRALAADPGNPDVAFNLAISLDRLRQSDEAVKHYERALELAAGRAAGFSPEIARLRLQQLAR